eukprot:jgi/Mesen1/3144/ME000184S02215
MGLDNSSLLLERLEPLLQQLRCEFNKTGIALALHAEPYHDEVRQLGHVYHTLPVYWLMAGHSMYCASLYHGQPFRSYWLLSLLVSFIAGYGGGTTVNVLFLKEHASWLLDDYIVGIFLLCWWLISYSPGNIGFRIFSLAPIKTTCKACSMILKSRTIFSKVDAAVSIFGAHAVVPPLFLGTLGGCGGRLLCDLAGKAFSLKEPVELAQPSWIAANMQCRSVRSVFSAALLYVATVFWMPILPHDVAQTLIMTLMVGQCIASELSGMELDLTQPFVSLFHSLTGIPAPPGRLGTGTSAATNSSPEKGKGRRSKKKHVE